MTAWRARALLLSLAAPLFGALAVYGQSALGTGFTIAENLGLAAVATGALTGEGRPTNLDASHPRRLLAHAPASESRIGARSGLSYMRGKVIVKYRDRPDFDLIPIDPNADSEAMAATLAARSDVEYAQAAYVMHPMLV